MMDVKEAFDSLARQEGPPSTTNVHRAMAAGRAVRRRRRAAAAATSAVGAAAAVLLAWSVNPWPEPQNSSVAAAPTTAPTAPAPEVTITVTPGAVHKGFTRLRKKYPPMGKIASVPPLLMWVSDAPRKGLLLCESGPNGSTCSSFPPLAKEFARVQGKLRGKAVWFGIANDEVHGVTVVTKDGRKLQANLARNVGPGLGLWAIQFPSGTDVLRLVITDAKGKALQQIPG
ncbi:hypothetical protein ACIBO5_41780 [Nonomuraea angiospora]|uniref:hypothetical protein n=1 Tax=Nonomuraea angiospora TaxID=46172 RepID=UPI0029A54F8E|nr:hypothetical protein [Nonomuraea angiospora]MDX3109595.1 hypothetical protein [Nonomuraea angiospora]